MRSPARCKQTDSSGFDCTQALVEACICMVVLHEVQLGGVMVVVEAGGRRRSSLKQARSCALDCWPCVNMVAFVVPGDDQQ
eukprot:JP435988.1.p3 GENE.JP435988.1~~JP435988.1.p3  ORF type:complete len:81 (-),score=12.52 JP435988.1:631-873(-)